MLHRRILIDLPIAILLSNICVSVSSIDTMNKGFLLGSMTVHQKSYWQFAWRHDTQHNDIQHYDTQHNDFQRYDTQHNDFHHYDTQHNDIKLYDNE